LIYKLVWDDFCAWYLEAIKPNYGEGISQEVYDKTIAYFEELMRLLHPFMPFLTEELYQAIAERSTEEALVIAQQKKAEPFNEENIKALKRLKN
jgi:valyl-tRNA synthetase